MEETSSIKILLTFGYDIKSNRYFMFGTNEGGGWVNKCIKARCGKSINNMPDVVVGIRGRNVQLMIHQRESTLA